MIKKLYAKIPISVYIVVFTLIILAGVLNFILNKPFPYYENKEIAIEECILACKKEIAKNTILTEGPCLSNEIVEGWACDIINQPKIDFIDNNPKNQCESYINKEVSHIVYVTRECFLVSAK